jgi:hypothetical protein
MITGLTIGPLSGVNGLLREGDKEVKRMGFDFLAAAKTAERAVGFITDHFPALKHWTMGVTIDHPQYGDEIPQGSCRVSGRYGLDFDKRFVLFHRVDDKYWPQGNANIEPSEKTWWGEVDIGPGPGEHWIIIAVIESEAMQLLIDYYFQTSTRTGGHPLPLGKVRKEWKQLASVKIHVV